MKIKHKNLHSSTIIPFTKSGKRRSIPIFKAPRRCQTVVLEFRFRREMLRQITRMRLVSTSSSLSGGREKNINPGIPKSTWISWVVVNASKIATGNHIGKFHHISPYLQNFWNAWPPWGCILSAQFTSICWGGGFGGSWSCTTTSAAAVPTRESKEGPGRQYMNEARRSCHQHKVSTNDEGLYKTLFSYVEREKKTYDVKSNVNSPKRMSKS